jgi:hypothetical protein
MIRLYIWLTLLITIELVSSGPLSSSNLLRRAGSRRGFTWNMNDIRTDTFYKRNRVYYNRYGVPTSVGRRAVVTKGTGLWPQGVIPYDMPNIKPEDQVVILESMKRIMDDTATNQPCITFTPRSPADDTYIIIDYGAPGDCSAHIGYYAGFNNQVTLGDGCMYISVVEHELMHVIGFQHEQNSPDRDKYVEVFIENIDPNYLDQFQKIDPNDVVDLGIPYDVDSVMQYPEDAFQKPGTTGKVMVAIDPANPIPPDVTDRRISPLDVLGVRRLYNC